MNQPLDPPLNPPTAGADAQLRRLAHDLRNAIGAVKNSAQLIRLRNPPDTAVLRAADTIDKQVAVMVRLLGEALDPSGVAPPAPGAAAAPPAESTARSTEPDAAARNMRLLLVDDSEAVRDTFAEILGDAGYQVRTAGDGEAALALAAEWSPDAVMLDIHIPGRNGYEVAAALRQQYSVDALKLVMFSGMHLDEVTLRESKRRGFDFCFDKTGDFADLDNWLQAAVPRATATN